MAAAITASTQVQPQRVQRWTAALLPRDAGHCPLPWPKHPLPCAQWPIEEFLPEQVSETGLRRFLASLRRIFLQSGHWHLLFFLGRHD